MKFDSFGDCKCKLTYVVLFFVLAFSIGCELLSGLSNIITIISQCLAGMVGSLLILFA